MAVPEELGRFERWLCDTALRAERAGPVGARALPLFELLLAALVLGLALRGAESAAAWNGVLAGVLAGLFFGQALPNLLWPRPQRMLALLYRACLEEGPGPHGGRT